MIKAGNHRAVCTSNHAAGEAQGKVITNLAISGAALRHADATIRSFGGDLQGRPR